MKFINRTLLALIVTILIMNACTRDVIQKEVLIKEFGFSGQINENIEGLKAEEITDSTTFNGAVARISIWVVGKGNSYFIKKVALYKSGLKDVTITGFTVGSPYNTGTATAPIMSLLGTFNFVRSTTVKNESRGVTFYANGKGELSIDGKQKMKEDNKNNLNLNGILNNIENDTTYKVAQKAPSIQTTGLAMDFIIKQSGLLSFLQKTDGITKGTLSEFIQTIKNTNKEFVQNSRNNTSFQLQGYRLAKNYKSILLSGRVNKNLVIDLQRLTELIKNVTIPIADPTDQN